MAEKKRCSECGNDNISIGRLGTVLHPGKKAVLGSKIEAEVCTQCGLILCLRITDKEAFRQE